MSSPKKLHPPTVLITLGIVGFVTLVAATSCGGDEVESSMSAKDVAGAYFEALTAGAEARANELATVPFSMDGREVFTTHEELAAFHAKVKSNKGEREVPPYTVGPLDAVPEGRLKLDAGQFPAHVVFMVELNLDDGDIEAIALFVTKGDAPKVMGFAD